MFDESDVFDFPHASFSLHFWSIFGPLLTHILVHLFWSVFDSFLSTHDRNHFSIRIPHAFQLLCLFTIFLAFRSLEFSNRSFSLSELHVDLGKKCHVGGILIHRQRFCHLISSSRQHITIQHSSKSMRNMPSERSNR